MTKKYKLLKDLPDAKIGSALRLHGNKYIYNNVFGDFGFYDKTFVENNPEWFAPIEEPKEEQPFQVGEKVRFGYMGENYEGEIRTAYYFKETALVCYFEDTITKYLEVPFSKLSKVESQPKTEKIEVKDFEFDMDKEKWLKFHFNKTVPTNSLIPSYYLKLKQAIEKILNNE